jgi:ketosteroid isomerase-like protein
MRKLSVVLVVLSTLVAAAIMLGQRGPQVPPATGPMLDVANKIAEAINKQDAATLQKMVAPDCVYLDEDGHAPPVARWITVLTTGTPAKSVTISSTHSQMWNDTGWVSFNYVLNETFKEQPKAIRGTASIVLRKAANGDWQMQLIHGALEQKVAGLTQ